MDFYNNSIYFTGHQGERSQRPSARQQNIIYRPDLYLLFMFLTYYSPLGVREKYLNALQTTRAFTFFFFFFSRKPYNNYFGIVVCTYTIHCRLNYNFFLNF